MAYSIRLRQAARRELQKLEAQPRRRISEAIDALAEDPRPEGTTKLKPRSPPRWRVRVGDYRIIYAIDDDARAVEVFTIGHRREIYRS